MALIAGKRCRWFIGVWAALEVFFFGGLIYGWPSLVLILKAHRVYENLCSVVNSDDNVTVSQGRIHSLHNSSAVDVTGSTEMMPAVPVSAKNDCLVLNASDRCGSNGSHMTNTSRSPFIGCPEQDAAFALAYMIVTAVLGFGSVVVGQAQRTLGMRVTRLVCGLLYACCLLMIAFVTPGRPVLLIIGMCGVGVGGLCLLVTNTQLGVLFGRGHSTFVGLMSGCYDISAIMQLAIKIVVSTGIGLFYTYLGMALISCSTLVSTLLWLPNGPAVATNRRPTLTNETETREENLKPLAEQTKRKNSPKRKQSTYVIPPELLSSLMSPLYIFHLMWYSVLHLRIVFFLSVFNRWLTQIMEGDEQQVDHFTSVQLYTGCASILFSLLAGFLYDFQRLRYSASPCREDRLLLPGVLPLIVGSGLCCLLSALVLIPGSHVLYLTFIVLSAYRSALYSLTAAFLALTFPPQLFGMLYGTMVIVGSLVGCLQYGLFVWAEISEQSLQHVNIFLLCTSAATVLHPAYITWKCRRARDITKDPSARPLPVQEDSGPLAKKSSECTTL